MPTLKAPIVTLLSKQLNSFVLWEWKPFFSLASIWKYENTSTCYSPFYKQIGCDYSVSSVSLPCLGCSTWAFAKCCDSGGGRLGMLYVTTDHQWALWAQPRAKFRMLNYQCVCLIPLDIFCLFFVMIWVFKVAWTTAFQRCLFYMKGKLLRQKFWFALFNNLYFWVPLMLFECMSNQQPVYQESIELIVNPRKKSVVSVRSFTFHI